MHVILTSMGTAGDVFPYVGLGARLRARGHRVTLAANEEFGPRAAAHGLGFRALISDEDMNRILGDPDFWHPLKGPGIGARWGAQLIGRQYALLAELAADGATVQAASPGVFAARLVQEKLSIPTASILLQPWLIASSIEPPVMPGGLTLPRWAPRWAGRLYWRLVDAVGNRLIGGHLNRIRASIGLAPVRRLFQWHLSPQRIIGLFPEWYGPPQSDWPPQIRLAGFPRCDGRPGTGLPPDLQQFCDEGAPPVAFTFGTGMRHAVGLFREAVAACRLLGVRGLLLTRHAGQLPANLPESVRHVDFVPFQELFPRCVAVVHHGGVGTVARALAAGTPQLIIPHAWDQFDNAVRVKRLRAGDWLKSHRRSAYNIARALATLLGTETRARCRALAARFDAGDGLDAAADLVEALKAPPLRALSEPEA